MTAAGFAGGKWARRQPRAGGGSGPEPEPALRWLGQHKPWEGSESRALGPAATFALGFLKRRALLLGPGA